MLLGRVEEAFTAFPITCITTVAVLLSFPLLLYLVRSLRIWGPWGVPYLGIWPFLGNETCYLDLLEYMKTYGPVYTFRSTGRLFIHLGSIKAIKEAHVTKSDCFTRRYTDFSMMTLLFGDGVTTANGEKWMHLRKFFIQSFREFGMYSAKELGSQTTHDAVDGLLDDLRKSNGSPVNIIEMFTGRCCSVMNRLLFNEDGASVEELLEINMEYAKLMQTFSGKRILLMGEFARRVILPLTPGYKDTLDSHRRVSETFRKIIRRHEEKFDEKNVRDIIDSYLKERNDRRKNNDPTADYFSETSLVNSLLQFVGDGILGVAVFMGFIVYELLNNPGEQEKIHSEIVNVIGTNRQVTLEDRKKLPYVNAFLQEVIRSSDFFTIFPSLECTKETTIQGRTVPKGAVTVTNFWAAQHDPDVYRNPEQFLPSRYLGVDGKQKEETPIAFGVGKRSCVGENFTMMTMFLFFASMMKDMRLSSMVKVIDKMEFLEGRLDICAHPWPSK